MMAHALKGLGIVPHWTERVDMATFQPEQPTPMPRMLACDLNLLNCGMGLKMISAQMPQYLSTSLPRVGGDDRSGVHPPFPEPQKACAVHGSRHLTPDSVCQEAGSVPWSRNQVLLDLENLMRTRTILGELRRFPLHPAKRRLENLQRPFEVPRSKMLFLLQGRLKTSRFSVPLVMQRLPVVGCLLAVLALSSLWSDCQGKHVPFLWTASAAA